ncbi:beta-ketoacyl-[acyl-carrier-protein] synthase family protein [Dactylosporangium aurantiacum]|uniref:Beta-ketoacyl-[acyl-carrier-protein] synthase family protein n=1 Tax=Dactylosporangium aurantiacum TaxID=35754 RepID=A0A9Q9IGY8_9ACTN|nr:beta-ketoacyl-[acyl-carrier-protein] synthase family protein [Dactylosporangium aurantiacum]MDG6101816.1 beta-ketoacyl-[acyl-carrier-protein] synthase family protein [Dactylosporangium aurantiacum]UWZ52380.1 beta-ketoacyl-[acyl-carrier-protein] synthase family protein [Dactylosporangium aurantiacum]
MPEGHGGRRVVVTGIGVVAPGAVGTKQYWEMLTAGRTATRTISRFDASQFRSRVAAECDFDPVRAGLTRRQIRRWDRTCQFAVVAAREALADSGVLDGLRPERTGVMVGTACGMTISLDQEYAVVSDEGATWLVEEAHASPYLFDYFVPSSMSAEVAWLVEAEGPVGIVSTGCTSGIDVLSHASDLIRDGEADVMIAGASDAAISPITVACFDAIKATTPRNDQPETASRPFDRTRDGFALGEGSAIFVLEELGHARRRGAHVYAEIAGYSSRSNAFSMTGLRPDGAELSAAIDDALDKARVDVSGIDYINAHGSATKQNDLHETNAYKRSLGKHAYTTPVSSIKSMIGHSLGAICSLEVAACALAVEHDVIPPTANLHEPDPQCDLDYVPLVAREQRTDVVLSVASGFGGFQSAIVLTDPDRRTP